MDISFNAPKVEDGKTFVEVPVLVATFGAEKWQHTVIGYVLGYNPSSKEMANFVKFRWTDLGVVKVHRMGKGIFIFQMATKESKISMLENGPWSFSRKPLILRSWSTGMPSDKPDLDHLPIWVQFPNLPLDLWTAEALSRLASHIDDPLFADMTSAEQSRLAYARVCVEISAAIILSEEIPVKYASGKEFSQKVDYEWVPMNCEDYMIFGHSKDMCRKRVVQQDPWIKLDSVTLSDQPEVIAEVEGDGVSKVSSHGECPSQTANLLIGRVNVNVSNDSGEKQLLSRR